MPVHHPGAILYHAHQQIYHLYPPEANVVDSHLVVHVRGMTVSQEKEAYEAKSEVHLQTKFSECHQSSHGPIK